MLGAIAGDIIGSQHEWREFKSKDFPLFTGACHYTDDSLMTLAIGEAFVLGWDRRYEPSFQKYVVSRMVKMGREHQAATWGERFYKWFMERPVPYGSCGNGAAMRISSVGWIANSEDEVRYFSRLVTEVSHDHPEGIKGAESVAMAIYLARVGTSPGEIKERMIEYYPSVGAMTVDGIRGVYGIDDKGQFITCQGSVPEAIVCFLEARSFEDAVRNAISLGGDADTQGAIAGSIAEAYFGVPIQIEDKVMEYLTPKLRTIYYAFNKIKGPRARR